MKTQTATIAITLLLFMTACDSSPANSSDSDVRQVNTEQVDRKRVVLFFEKGSDEPFTGQVVQRYRGGELRSALNVVNGLPTGKSTEWYESGQQKNEQELVAGKPVGSMTAWYENGQLYGEMLVEDGKKKQSTEWYETGQMKSQETFADGRPEEIQTWYENGQMESHTTNARSRDKKIQTWDENGVDTTVPREIEAVLNLIGGAKAAVVEFYYDHGKFPVDNEGAGLSPASEITNEYVTSVTIDDGKIVISLGHDAGAEFTGRALILTPTAEIGSVSWQCSSSDIDPTALPEMCR